MWGIFAGTTLWIFFYPLFLEWRQHRPDKKRLAVEAPLGCVAGSVDGRLTSPAELLCFQRGYRRPRDRKLGLSDFKELFELMRNRSLTVHLLGTILPALTRGADVTTAWYVPG
jgi:hypothetical protein